jgi:hypothetical protein
MKCQQKTADGDMAGQAGCNGESGRKEAGKGGRIAPDANANASGEKRSDKLENK